MWLPLSRALGCTKLYTYSHIISMTSSSDRSSWENIIHIRPAVPEDVPGIMWMVQVCSLNPAIDVS